MLLHRVSRADPTSLNAMSASVTATVAASQATAQQSPPSTDFNRQAQVTLYAASEEAHRTTENFVRDFYEKREFDPYLRFASKQDEEEYRKREAEYREAIEKARDEHTPAGELRALDLSIAQMKNAGAHGAVRSKYYQPELNALETSRRNLVQQIEKTPENRSMPTKDNGTSKPKTAASTDLPPDLLATIRSTKVEIADQNSEGHGVSATAITTQDVRGRG